MPTQFKHLDFSGQNIYAGLDVHKSQFTVTILSDSLNLKTFSQEADFRQLVKYLKDNYPHANYKAAYEAGFSGFWLQEALVSEGIDCIVVNPADIPTGDKERKRKRDALDSAKIARSLRNGELEGIHIPTKQTQFDRSLVRSRFKLVRDLTRCKNRIKSYLNFFGIDFPDQFKEPGSHWSKRFIEWLRSLELDGGAGKWSLGIMIKEAEGIRALILSATRQIRILSRSKSYLKRSELLVRVPGVGLLTSMVLLTELEDINRFKRIDELCAFVGLVPNVSSSADKERVGDITSRSNKVLRNMIIESSWVAVRKDPALTMKYEELCSRMKANKAIIKIARKLLNRIRSVLINEQEYQISVVA